MAEEASISNACFPRFLCPLGQLGVTTEPMSKQQTQVQSMKTPEKACSVLEMHFV